MRLDQVLMIAAEPMAAHLAHFDGRFLADKIAKYCERIIHTRLMTKKSPESVVRCPKSVIPAGLDFRHRTSDYGLRTYYAGGNFGLLGSIGFESSGLTLVESLAVDSPAGRPAPV
jgi:hypothetical protein